MSKIPIPSTSFKIAMIIAVALVCFVQADQLFDDEITDELSTPFNSYQLRCSELFQTSIRHFLLFLTGQLDKDKDKGYKSQVMCWVNCLLQKANIINVTTGSIRNDVMVEKILAYLPESEKSQIKINGEKCQMKAETERLTCLRGYEYVKCIYTAIKEKYTKKGAGAPKEEKPGETLDA